MMVVCRVDEVSTICWEMAERESFLLHTPQRASENNDNNNVVDEPHAFTDIAVAGL